MSYALSLFGVVHVSHYPTFLSIEPSHLCQLSCPECPIGMRKQQGGTPMSSRPIEPFPNYPLSLLTECFSRAHTVQFYFQGEPLLYSGLMEMIRAAAKEGCYTIVSTNGLLVDRRAARALVRSGLHHIIVSMDGLTQSSYGAYRQGGRVEQAKEALRYLKEERDIARREGLLSGEYPIIELQCLLLRSNEGERGLFRKTYRLLGADRLRFKTAQFYDYQYGNVLMPVRESERRYAQCGDGTYRLKRSWVRRLWQAITGISPCYRLWAGCVVTTNGNVLPCCYDKEQAHSYGNIHSDSLLSIFRSENANRFRWETIRAPFKRAPEMCQNCWH